MLRNFLLMTLLCLASTAMAQDVGFSNTFSKDKPQGKAAQFYQKQEETRWKDSEEDRRLYQQYIQEADNYYKAEKYQQAKQAYQNAKTVYLRIHSNASFDNDTKALDAKIDDCDKKANTQDRSVQKQVQKTKLEKVRKRKIR